ncbi:hypothetical protein V493_06758 [Pseudogymnoascus sp. VKM F-4281 (FW-2241)]|nr:hypothetical protein V493_06758 [Pseudogymnoascus sp. VKM F-4281 (FW-2241)]
MIIREVSPDSPTASNPPPRRYFANHRLPPPPRIIEEVPNNAARKTLAELFASYPKPGQPVTNATSNPFSQNAPVPAYPMSSLPSFNTNTTYPPQNTSASSYNPTQHIVPPPCLWFPPRPPGQDIDGNATIYDNPWTPVPFSATMEDAPCTPGPPAIPRSKSVSMSDQPRNTTSKFEAFFSDIASLTTNVSSKSAYFQISNHEKLPARRHSEVNSHLPFPHPAQESIRRILATAPALPGSSTSGPKYVNPFLPRPITVPPNISFPPKSSPESVSPRTPTAPAPQLPNVPFPQFNSHPFGVPPTVHVLDDWPYGPLLDTMSPRTRRFAVGGTDADGNDLAIYRPRLSRDTYLECLPPTTRVEVRCPSRACGQVCEFDGRAGVCRRRSAAAKDAALWGSYMWACEGCEEEMEMQVLEVSEGTSPTGTGDACSKKDERDGYG